MAGEEDSRKGEGSREAICPSCWSCQPAHCASFPLNFAILLPKSTENSFFLEMSQAETHSDLVAGHNVRDSSIMLSVCRPVIILLQASELVLQSQNHCMNLFMRLN